MRRVLFALVLLPLAGCNLTQVPEPPSEDPVFCRPAFYWDDGNLVDLCELDGRTWDEMPEVPA